MGEDTTTANGDQASTSSTLQASTSTTDDQASVSQATTTEKPEHERIIEQLRKENAASRKRLAEFEKAQQEAENASLSKTELLQKELDALKSQHEAASELHLANTIKYEVQLQAASLGAKPERLNAIAKMIEWDDIEVDDNNNPTNIRSLLEQLAKDVPELFGKGGHASTSGGATNPPRSQTDGNTGEITQSYVADIMSGKVQWQSLTPERRTAVLNWQAKHPFRF